MKHYLRAETKSYLQAYLSRRCLHKTIHDRGAAPSEAQADDITLHYPDSLTHFPRLNPQDLDQGARFARNLELLDPFESQALVPSSVFTLLLNPNWLAASGSEEREHFTTQLDQDGRRMDRPAEPERQSVALLTRTVRNSENHWISRPPSRPAGLVGQTWQPVQVRNT